MFGASMTRRANGSGCPESDGEQDAPTWGGNPAGGWPNSLRAGLGRLRLQGFGEDGAKRVGAKGFRDDGQPPLVGTLRHGGLTQPRDEDDWQERDAAPDGFHDYPSADRGDNDIDEDKIPVPSSKRANPLTASAAV